MSDVSGSCHVPARPGIVSWSVDGVDDPNGMSELQEQAITSIASTKDKKVINTFLLRFMAFSFVNDNEGPLILLYNFTENLSGNFFSFLSCYFFHPSHLPIHQADLDAMRMHGRTGQDILDDALGELAGGLVLFQDDADT
jgi:hypothetical protein